MKKKLGLLTLFSMVVFLFLCSCGQDPIVGKWVSDYNTATVIELRKDSTMTVTSESGGTIDGIYELGEGQIAIKLYADGFTDSISAKYEIENNKLRLTRSDGQIEQFSRK